MMAVAVVGGVAVSAAEGGRSAAVEEIPAVAGGGS